MGPAKSPTKPVAAARGGGGHYCASGCGTARLKEAEAAWARERGQLRREAALHQRRAMLLEAELTNCKTAQRVRLCEVSEASAQR